MGKGNERVRLKDIFVVLKKNRYVWILSLMDFVLNFVTSMGVSTYYFKYIVGDISLLSIMAFSQTYS